MEEREEVNIMVDRKVHKALRLRALMEDKKVKELTNEILAEALGVKEEGNEKV